jgi:ActR/RegA family two-component response regulator
MIMLLTHQEELRRQLTHALHLRGHEVAIPPHREDMLTVLETSKPELVILDLYLADRSGAENLRLIHDHEYAGAVLVLSGPSMMPIVNVIYASGLRVTRVVQAPANINGQYDLGNLESSIQTLIGEVANRKKCHASIAQRAYEIYESAGRQDGNNVQHWLRAEQEVAGSLGMRTAAC